MINTNFAHGNLACLLFATCVSLQVDLHLMKASTTVSIWLTNGAVAYRTANAGVFIDVKVKPKVTATASDCLSMPIVGLAVGDWRADIGIADLFEGVPKGILAGQALRLLAFFRI